ncbi:MAG: PfkB family carbohydrate kinase [Pseudomonadota bacterium]
MIVTCGEALVDLVPDQRSGKLLYRPVLGGSLYTVALGIARMGGQSGYLWELSRDALGQSLLDALQSAGVDCAAATLSERATPVAVVDTSGSEPRYAIADPDQVMSDTRLGPLPRTTRCLHLGSAVLAKEPVGTRLEALAATAPLVTIDYNVRAPSIVDRRAYAARLRRIAQSSGIVKASTVDIDLIGEGEAQAYMRALVDEGATMAILTAADAGAFAFTREASAFAPSCAFEIDDPVGAGDSFMAAVLSTLQSDGALSHDTLMRLSQTKLKALLEHGHRAAAFTCRHQGAVMPSMADLVGELG